MFKNMSIGTKLMISFLGVSGITLIVGLIGFFGVSKLGDNLEEVAVVRLPSIVGLAYINEAQTAIQGTERTMLLQGIDKKVFDTLKNDLDEAWADVAKGWKIYEPLPQTKDEELLWKEFVPAWEKWKLDHKRITGLTAEGKRDEAMALSFDGGDKSFHTAEVLLNKITALNEKIAKEEQVQGLAMVKLVKIICIVAVALGTGLSILLGFFIGRSIKRPLVVGVEVANRLAKGDLSVEIEVTSNDETGKLLAAMKIMTENLRSIIGKVADTSTQVAAAANQLHSTAELTATGAEEVAAQAGTVATAGEEISATSSDIANNCQMAAEAALRASQSANSGSEVVERTVAVMGQIAAQVQATARTVESLGERSDQIGAIIGTIEDIADQTNLLALNAAIEAARAGEHGRGFAVVADEVRALAERTTRATKEIGGMIKAIQNETKGAVTAMEQGVQQVEAGTVEAAKSGDALRDILEQINAVSMQVNQIATAAEEQTATTGEISSNMTQITQVVQDTAGGAHQSAAAAAQLSGNAEELQRLVRQFKLQAAVSVRWQGAEEKGWVRAGLTPVPNPI